MEFERKDEWYNIPKSIIDKVDKNLHNRKNHPVCIVKERIFDFFDKYCEDNKLPLFKKYDDLHPVVSVKNNFDFLRIPTNHPSRSKSDTYYLEKDYVLRTHTSAHQIDLLKKGDVAFLVAGDVYRKDEIDKSHYPVFHQLEGVCMISNDKDPIEELKKILSALVEHLFPKCEYRFLPDYFPFTDPSLQVEVLFNGKWLEILGAGKVHHEVLDNAKIGGNFFALGLGIDRLCMIFFDIPDIRLLWSEDERFLTQFGEGKSNKFMPYCNFDSVTKDISFWIDEKMVSIDGDNIKWLLENDFYEMIREIGGNEVENVEIIDKFYHPKKQMHSRTYRLTFSCQDVSIKNQGQYNDLINKFMNDLKPEVTKLNVQIR